MSRKIRQEVKAILKDGDLLHLLEFVETVPPKKVVQPLIQTFYKTDSLQRWHAVTAFGSGMNRIAGAEMEDARIIMRRLMWSLNDESGGIGWGAPEAMAEAMANNAVLAEEYSRILLSYIWEEGNYLEYLPLRRGALWGLMRLAQSRPDIFNEIDCARLVKDYLKDNDAESRALAALALGFAGKKEFCDEIANMLSDRRMFKLYLDMELREISVADAAAMALEKLTC